MTDSETAKPNWEAYGPNVKNHPALALADNARPGPGRLKGAGGDGTSGGMEARIAALEAHMEHVREDIGLMRDRITDVAADVGTLKTQGAVLDTKVSNLPTFRATVTVALVIIGLLSAAIAFAPALQRIAGQVPAAPVATK